MNDMSDLNNKRNAAPSTRPDLAVTRVRHPVKFRLLQVIRVQPLTPGLVRITLTGDDLAAAPPPTINRNTRNLQQCIRMK